MSITGYQLIGYSKSGKSKETFSGTGPGETKAELFHEASTEEINEAVMKATAAFSVYRKYPAEKKAVFLDKLAAGIDNSRALLISVATRESGLPGPRLDGEVSRTVNQAKLFASLLREGSWVRAIIDLAIPDRAPLPKPDLRQIQQAIGPVAVFGASNFPFAFSVAGGDTVSALAAGCPVLYKAHPGHPATSELVAEILVHAAKESGLPDGVFSLIQGVTHHTGMRLVEHPDIKAVSFTGSFVGGKALFDAAARRKEPIPVYSEMGSVNPVFLLPEILKTKGPEVARALAASNTLSAGQFCTNPGIIVSNQSAESKSFMNEFAETIKSTPGAVMLTDAIYSGYARGIRKVTDKNTVSLMAVAGEEKKGYAQPHMFSSTGENFLDDESLWEEIFGPESIHVEARDNDQLLRIASAIPGQLTVSVWGTENDLLNHRELLEILELKAGRIIVNNVPTGVEVTAAMVHGGPYPATTDSKYTSVGTQAIYRFTRPVCYQNFPKSLLPEELKNENPRGIWRMVNSQYNNDHIQ